MSLGPLDPDQLADVMLASALTGIPADQIGGWTIIIHTESDKIEVRTEACCIHHAGVALRDHVGPDMAQLPPCSGEPS